MSDPAAELNGTSALGSDATTEAIRRAVREAVVTHAKLGRAVPISRDGRVVWISPEEILSHPPAISES